MMHLDVGGKLVPIAAGETFIGSAPDCAVVLEGQGVRPRHAVLRGTEGAAAIRAAEPEATLFINGIRLGGDPTPVLHGDKIQIGTHELLAVDTRRSGNTQLFDSGAFTDLIPPPVGQDHDRRRSVGPDRLSHRRAGIHHQRPPSSSAGTRRPTS